MILTRSSNILFGLLENGHIHNVILLLLNLLNSYCETDVENDNAVLTLPNFVHRVKFYSFV